MPSPPSPRPDRRRARTRAQFFDALIALIFERGYDPITIQDIADRANLGRATFYLHFRDKDDLLFSILREHYDRIAADQPPITLTDLLPDSPPPALMVFQHVAEHRALYRLLLQSEAGLRILARVRGLLADYLQAEFIAFMQTAGITATRLPLALLVEHMAASSSTLVVWWLGQDDATTFTAEEMARHYHQLNVRAWLYVLGIDPPP